MGVLILSLRDEDQHRDTNQWNFQRSFMCGILGVAGADLPNPKRVAQKIFYTEDQITLAYILMKFFSFALAPCN